MTVNNTNRLTSRARSVGLPDISEELEPNSAPVPDSVNRSGITSHSTEYDQAFRARGGTRPRNPVSGWHIRNLSNILPSGPELPSQPSRASRRPPPEAWLARQATSQIFPPTATPQPAQNENDPIITDVNNNPNTRIPAPPIVAGGRRRTGRWPWQVRAQASSIFLSDAENTIRPRPHTSQSRYPWQERAQKSVIFEVLTGQDTGPKPKVRRSYDWDQRQSKLITELVHQRKWDSETNNDFTIQNGTNTTAKSTTKQSSWPWKERAKQSEVFRSPEKLTCTRPVNYAWDQRKSRFSLLLDPTSHFSTGSSYKDNFVKWQSIQSDKVMKAAGKPCYKEDTVKSDIGKEEEKLTSGTGGGKRKFKAKPTFRYDEFVAPNSSDVKGETCLDIVPLGYQFSRNEVSTERRRNVH